MKFVLTYSFISEHSIHGVFVLEEEDQEGSNTVLQDVFSDTLSSEERVKLLTSLRLQPS